MAINNKCVAVTKENLLDHNLKRDSLSDFAYGIVRFLGIIIQNIYCVSSYLVLSWIILFPISWIRSDLYSKAENYLYNSLLFIVSSWSLAAGANVVESGDEYKHLIEEPDKYLANCEAATILSKANGHHLETTNTTKQKSNVQPMQSGLNTNGVTGKELIINNLKKSGDRSTNCFETDLKSSNDLLVKPKSATVFNNNNINNNNNNNNEKNFTRESNSGSISNECRTATSVKPMAPMNLAIGHKKPRVLMLCNHISTADVPLIMQSFSTLTNQSLLWVLDAAFKPTNFGLVCSSHGDFFIAKDSFNDGSLRDQVLKHPDRNLLVLFPEGGFWRKRLDGSNRYALRNNLPMTQYVTHPRFGAFKDLIDPSVEVTHIVDATLIYDDIKNPLSILDIALGNRKEPAILNFKVYNRSEINPTEEWLRNIWLEKDKLLQQYYENRDSVYDRFEGTMRTTKLDWLKVLSVHLFYLLVCYLTVYRLFNATSSTMLKARDLYYSTI